METYEMSQNVFYFITSIPVVVLAVWLASHEHIKTKAYQEGYRDGEKSGATKNIDVVHEMLIDMAEEYEYREWRVK